MKCKHLKLIMELIFIFILPLLILLPCVSIYNDYEYDSYGNYVSSHKIIKFDNIFEYGFKGFSIKKLDYRLFRVSDRNDNNSIYDNVYFTPSYIFLAVLNTNTNSNIYIPCDIVMYDGFYRLNVPNGIVLPSGLTNAFKTFYLTETNENFLVIDNNIYFNVNSLMNDVSVINSDGVVYNLVSIQYLPNVIYTYNIEEIDNLTLLGKYKFLFTEYLNFNDSPILDLFISYNFLWLMMFISWHFLYSIFDFIVHLVNRERRRE